jgi:hypothetical protein
VREQEYERRKSGEGKKVEREEPKRKTEKEFEKRKIGGDREKELGRERTDE